MLHHAFSTKIGVVSTKTVVLQQDCIWCQSVITLTKKSVICGVAIGSQKQYGESLGAVLIRQLGITFKHFQKAKGLDLRLCKVRCGWLCVLRPASRRDLIGGEIDSRKAVVAEKPACVAPCRSVQITKYAIFGIATISINEAVRAVGCTEQFHSLSVAAVSRVIHHTRTEKCLVIETVFFVEVDQPTWAFLAVLRKVLV